MVKTRIILNGQDVDLIDDVSIPITYNIADIRNPAARDGHYSKTVKLPGTDINNKLFSHIWDLHVTVNSSGTTNYNLGFDPNLKVSVTVIYDGSVIFEGFLQLNKIVQSHLGYKHDFEVTLSSAFIDLYSNMGEKTLADLDLSIYDHAYNQTEQVNSWATSIKVNGVSTAFSKGTGYVYPMIDYGRNNDVNYKVTDFFPAIYQRTIYNAIITENGFQVSSDFIDSTYFKSLIFPYTGDTLKLTSTQILNRTHKASSTGTYTSYSSGVISYDYPIIFDDDSTGTNHDAGNIYNTSTYLMIAPKNGYYKLTFSVDLSLIHYPSSSPGTVIGEYLGWYEIVSYNPSLNIHVTQASVPVWAGSANYNLTNTIGIQTASSVTTGQVSGTGSGKVIAIAGLSANDQVYCRFIDAYNTTSLYNDTGYTALRLEAGSYFESEMTDTTIQEGDTLEMSSVLPATIKQKDFFNSINKTYNLYYEPDKNVQNKFFVEPCDDFYASSGTTRDWSQKLDESMDLETIPMGELDFKTLLLAWKPDTDNFNKAYTDKWGEIYGQRKYNVTNDWVSNVKKIETIFSPSPLVDRAGSDRVLTRIYQINNGVVSPKTANPRILYYSGVKNTSFTWNYMASSGTTAMTTYPYAGHLDDVDSPSYDVNFGVPQEVFYTATSYTNNNIFNEFWKKYINEITDKDSKIVTGYFHLTPVDIALLSFRDRYFFRNENFRLNKIYDYNPIETKPTKCEFIKIKNGIPFVSTRKSIDGGKGDPFTDPTERIPSYSDRIMRLDNFYGSDAMVRGERNIVDPSAKGVIISGNRNFVGTNCENICLYSSSGCSVIPGVVNLTAINCTGQTFDTRHSGFTFINNSTYGYANFLIKTGSYKGSYTDYDKQLVFELAANGQYELPISTSIYNGWMVKIKNANNSAFTLTVTIIDSTTWVAGDGTTATTHVIAAAGSYNYMFRNDVWYITT